eukprot:5681934-Alexandrium_andersonii.AAC.1
MQNSFRCSELKLRGPRNDLSMNPSELPRSAVCTVLCAESDGDVRGRRAPRNNFSDPNLGMNWFGNRRK